MSNLGNRIGAFHLLPAAIRVRFRAAAWMPVGRRYFNIGGPSSSRGWYLVTHERLVNTGK
jgi:hypothetical protein